MSKTYAPLSNYYGTVHVFEDNGFFLALENWDDTKTIEISKCLYEAFIKEAESNDAWQKFNQEYNREWDE